MKKGLLLLFVFTILFGFLLTGCEGLDAFLDEGNGNNEANGGNEDGSLSVQKNVMPDVVGKLADEAISILKKAKIKTNWNYSTQDEYILQYYGSKTNAAPPDTYLHIWVVKKQSVDAGQEGTEQVTLTVGLDTKIASDETVQKGNVVLFTGTIIRVSTWKSNGYLSSIVFKTNIPVQSDSEEEEHLLFYANDGPESAHLQNGSIFEVVGYVTGRPDWAMIYILSMTYRGKQ